MTDATANVLGFVDGSDITEEYIYDPMGNMTSDKNKKVTVSYNHLHLPDQILKENGDYVKFTYDAAGTKRKAETKTGATIETRDYVGNFVFLNGQLEHIIHSEGRVVMEAGVPKYEYFLRDHLGNVRQVVRATTPVARIATMEAANQEEESKHFEMLQPSRQSDHRHNVTEGGRDIAWLNAARGRILGPATSMEVNEGDSVHLSVYGKYVRKRRKAMKSAALPSGSAQQILSDLGNMAQSGGANPILLFQIADLVAADLEKKESPEAYMGYALYDADSNLYEKGKILLSSLAENRHEQLSHGIKVEKGGYIETFLVNETAEDVFFDNFRIQSQPSITVQVMHYYPFGMEMPALAYNNPAMIKNRYLYNQGTGDVTHDTERLPDLNVDLTKFRVYDPALGRWWQVDPMADAMSSWTPYNYGFNSPIRFNDPLGDEPENESEKTESDGIGQDQSREFFNRTSGRDGGGGAGGCTPGVDCPGDASLDVGTAIATDILSVKHSAYSLVLRPFGYQATFVEGQNGNFHTGFEETNDGFWLGSLKYSLDLLSVLTFGRVKGVTGGFFAKTGANASVTNGAKELLESATGGISKAVHGNSLASLRPTWGYRLYSSIDNSFLKNGITSKLNPESRYTKDFMADKFMETFHFPNRKAAWDWEFKQNKVL